ncbi:MAG: hypothetical protein J6A21_08080 [Lentisphaeria bacterium]|nr:hypothetical protein [Lentisphaeria bacterium]
MNAGTEGITVNRVTFHFGKNGLPERIILPEELDSNDLLAAPGQWNIADETGRKLEVVMDAESEMEVRRKKDHTSVKFHALKLSGDDTLSMTVRYTLYDDGAVFAEPFLVGTVCHPPKLSKLELVLPLALKQYSRIRFAMPYRPKTVDGKLIQTSAPERELVPGDDRIVKDGIFPQIGLYVCSEKGPAFYAEIFMESDGSAAGKNADTCSSVLWKDGNPTLSWNFQSRPDAPVCGPWQWRNRFGFVIAPAPRERRYPPFAMYHYFDNFQRYPTDQALQAVADSGADVLIIHENWRTDIQNGGIPLDRKRLKEVVDFAHSRNIRVALYMRGSEPSVDENHLDWFSEVLTPGFDGLYMDYGGPFGFKRPASEFYPGGSIRFRHHHNLAQLRRDTVERTGIVLSHTGPMYSAIGMTGNLIDGYVSGEGERGLLLRSRFDHAYYSMAAVCSGTLWSAAFPEYGSKEIVPFLAATGQYPHVPLGTQFKSCSLSHPPVPGINDAPFAPLWRLWQLMKGKEDLAVFNDYNSYGVFPKQENVSHYMMISGTERAVCIYGNFSKEPVKVDPAVFWEKTSFPAEGKKITLCMDLKAVPWDGKTPFELPGLGVAAICIGDADFAAYERPWPALCEQGKKYLETVEEQKRLRKCPAEADNYFLRIKVPDIALSYENSMVLDLYDNRFVLGEVMEDGSFRKLGYLGSKGFQKEETKQEEFVMNGEESPWIDLKAILGSGTKNLAVWSLHRGDLYYVNTPFYSFIQAELGTKEGKADYMIQFMNELEDDRAFLHFTVKIR